MQILDHETEPAKKIAKEARHIGLTNNCGTQASAQFCNDTNVFLGLEKEVPNLEFPTLHASVSVFSFLSFFQLVPGFFFAICI